MIYMKNKKQLYLVIKKSIEKRRKLAFQILGNKCAKCGITDPDVLCVDHIEPVGKNRKQTTIIYSEICTIKERSLNKYQLLCRNCNWKKMVDNNESKPSMRMFAYKHELEDLETRVKELEQRMQGSQPTKKKKQGIERTTELMNKVLCGDAKITGKDSKPNAFLIQLYLQRYHNISISNWRSYQIRRMLIEKQSNQD